MTTATGDRRQDHNQDFAQQLEIEFRDSAVDLLEQAERIVAAGFDSGSLSTGGRDSIYRVAHTIKGLAASCGYSLIGVVAHRFEDYLAEISQPVREHLDAIQKFIDSIGDLVENLTNERRINAGEFIRKLPSRPTFDLGEIVVQDIEVLLVMTDDAVARHVARELQACGYRVTRESGSFRAIEIATMTRPDLVIVTGVLDTLSGIDIVSAFRAMPATKDLPVALITADSRDEALHDGLPDSVPVIRKGREFGDDLTDALTQLGIL
ncbi:MAG: Hpt domain-containing protein [Proteobacteria bacterium]|nr:Hpt domain-containing protein [Pseudomonadota bacterium]